MTLHTQIWFDTKTIAKLDKIGRVLGTDIDGSIEVLIDEAYPLYEGRADYEGDDCAGAVV